ncbi:cytokine receptor family member B15 [Carassius auratus]|uniref:Interleukin-10 receptor subunit beta-like n=1 Tax=Carassius auratus TaxID=7957 RepID=A0A6P6JKM9_CARAU|nr:interleukin-10 receptor subunit beta-like [Carassius auratus]XP_026060308.1 interleukin-10 receptor subunit beta-like [Carassius auratus]
MLSVMSVKLRVLALILFVTKDVYPTYAEAKLASPQNVKVTSINMATVVEWTSPHSPMSNVTYTAIYFLRKENVSICVNTKELKCDVGKLPSVFGRYIFQVRAEVQGLFSEWVNSNEFLPNKHTIIGPPTVHLVIQNNTLDVHVQAPVLKVGKLADLFSQVSYIIRYWTEDFSEEATEKKVTESGEGVKVSVKGLQSWSRYCAQAMVVPKGYKNAKKFSDAVCVTNTPVLIICVIAAAILLPLAILAAWLIYKVYRFLYPKTKLPELLKNLFVPTFWNAEATQHPAHQKEQHDKISAISEDYLYEELSEKYKILEDKDSGLTSALTPIQEVEEDYKLLMDTKTAPAFYPNHLYPLCLKDSLFTHLNQPCFTSTQPCYYNVTELSHTDCVC